MKAEERDIKVLSAIMLLLKEGTFDLKGSEVPSFLITYQWLETLKERFEDDLKPKVKKKVKKK